MTPAGTGSPDVKSMHGLPACTTSAPAWAGTRVPPTAWTARRATTRSSRRPAPIALGQAENRLHTIKAVLVATLED
ncbi:hypothetical protein AB0D38_38310 [Streptomyces sp. NPDC048279]|uniref:hypothetical protein n=1 Tax=Streptomyces sp. NPDC048279 TaxID=3154714 RepID=UPI003430B0FF